MELSGIKIFVPKVYVRNEKTKWKFSTIYKIQLTMTSGLQLSPEKKEWYFIVL